MAGESAHERARVPRRSARTHERLAAFGRGGDAFRAAAPRDRAAAGRPRRARPVERARSGDDLPRRGTLQLAGDSLRRSLADTALLLLGALATKAAAARGSLGVDRAFLRAVRRLSADRVERKRESMMGKRRAAKRPDIAAAIAEFCASQGACGIFA